MKIVIDDPSSRMDGKGELEISPTETIRFEVDGSHFKVSIAKTGIKIHKDGLGQAIYVIPNSSNVIEIQ